MEPNIILIPHGIHPHEYQAIDFRQWIKRCCLFIERFDRNSSLTTFRCGPKTIPVECIPTSSSIRRSILCRFSAENRNLRHQMQTPDHRAFCCRTHFPNANTQMSVPTKMGLPASVTIVWCVINRFVFARNKGGDRPHTS